MPLDKETKLSSPSSYWRLVKQNEFFSLGKTTNLREGIPSVQINYTQIELVLHPPCSCEIDKYRLDT